MTNQHDPSAPIPDMPENQPGTQQPGAQPSGSVPAPAGSASAAAAAQQNPQASAQQTRVQPASSLVDRLAQDHQLTDVDHEPVSYTHLTLPTILRSCRSRWSPYH